jgi:hypothetical protein
MKAIVDTVRRALRFIEVIEVPGANWEAASLRLALFTQQAAGPGIDTFTAFAGNSPDSDEDRPKEGTRRQVGPLDNADLQVITTPVRVDIALSVPAIKPEEMLGSFPISFGQLDAELAKFETRSLAWVAGWRVPTIRVALLVAARARADTIDGAYEILKDNLRSVNVQPGKMSDLVFRVNWKASTSAFSEGYYNRISNWSAQRVMVNAGGGLPGRLDIQVSQRDFAQMDLDLNTPGERSTALLRGELAPIFKGIIYLTP